MVQAISKSGLIMKQIMAQQESLLLIDSLGTYRDRTHIDAVKPKDIVCTFKVIPPGCTPYLQPLDVLYFRQFKAVLKRIEDHIILNNLQFTPSTRDSISLLMCIIHNQFSSPVFADFIRYRYSWTIPRYDAFRPGRFKTPPEWIFDVET